MELVMTLSALNQSCSVTSANEAFVKTLAAVRNTGIPVTADDSKSVGSNRSTLELQNFTICITDPRNRLIRLPEYKIPLVTAIARFIWMMAGNNRLADIAFYER